jgi:hypothetical protein
MKNALFLCVLAVNAHAAQPILVRVTPETLARLQERDPMIRLVKPAEGEANVERPVKQSIIGDSTILHDGNNWTLIPKGAVLHQPEAMKARVNVKPVGKLLSWSDFLTRNRSWITTTEVTFDQAAGNEELDAGRTAFWAKQDKIVVATHQAGPISVRVASNPNHKPAKP